MSHVWSLDGSQPIGNCFLYTVWFISDAMLTQSKVSPNGSGRFPRQDSSPAKDSHKTLSTHPNADDTWLYFLKLPTQPVCNLFSLQCRAAKLLFEPRYRLCFLTCIYVSATITAMNRLHFYTQTPYENCSGL